MMNVMNVMNVMIVMYVMDVMDVMNVMNVGSQTQLQWVVKDYYFECEVGVGTQLVQ